MLEFEDVTVLKGNEQSGFQHSEDLSSFQVKFASHVKKLKAEFEKLDNPVLADETKELYQLGIKDVMSDDVSCAVKNIHSVNK